MRLKKSSVMQEDQEYSNEKIREKLFQHESSSEPNKKAPIKISPLSTLLHVHYAIQSRANSLTESLAVSVDALVSKIDSYLFTEQK